MDVTQYILHPPPATSNKLDAFQRARLIRSTRKLGAILGTTPRLAEPEPIPITLLPIGRVSTSSCSSASSQGHDRDPQHGWSPSYSSLPPSKSTPVYKSWSTNSSEASLAPPPPYSGADLLPPPKSSSSKPRRSKDAPQSLVLRVNTVAVAPDDVRVPMSPFTASVPAECRSPILPPIPTEAEIRRKRMAKLARTFGENVPPEIVFPSAAPSPLPVARGEQPVENTQPRTREICITPPPRRSSRVWTTGNSAGGWTGEWNRKDIREVQQKLRMLKYAWYGHCQWRA